MIEFPGNLPDGPLIFWLAFREFFNLHQWLHFVVKLSQIETGFHHQGDILITAVRFKILQLMHKAKTSLAYLGAYAILVSEDGSLERAIPFKCTDVTVDLHDFE